MYKEERIHDILEIMKEYGYVTVEFLVEKVHASPASIRRDLCGLARLGAVRKSYGGASLVTDSPHLAVPYSMRIKQNRREKTIIASKAAKFVHDGDTVMIDHSSSASYMAQYLAQKKDITVITNNMTLAMELKRLGTTVYCTGGNVNSSNILSGRLAEDGFGRFRADIGFFSTHGMARNGDFLDLGESSLGIFNTIVGCCNKAVYLCTRDKIGVQAPVRVFGIDKVYAVVSENDIRDELECEPGNVLFV